VVFVRKIVQIDEDRCDGCGLCVPSCAEGAIAIVNGKARLIGDVFCDGLGACLGECPQDAIRVVEREAAPYDERAVERHLVATGRGIAAHTDKHDAGHVPAVEHAAGHAQRAGGCPGSGVRELAPPPGRVGLGRLGGSGDAAVARSDSQLGHWPIQITLVPPHAPFLRGADVLVCADCVPFAVPDFHTRYLQGRAVLVGCPKLDNLPFYREKLEQILRASAPRSVTVLKMEVPCCGGLAIATAQAASAAGVLAEVGIHTIGVRGDLDTTRVPLR